MMPRQRRKSIRLKLIIALVCALVILGLWAHTVQRIRFEHDQAVAAAMSSNANLAIAYEQQVFRTIKAAEQVATFVREQYLARGPDIDLQHMVAQGVIRESMFTIVSVVNDRGDVVASTQPGLAVNYADREFFRAQRNAGTDDLFISRPVIGRVSGEARIPMSLRISRPDDAFAGVVVISVDPAAFSNFYNHAGLDGLELLEFTGLDGVVRARNIGRETSFGLEAGGLSWFAQQSASPMGSFLDDGGRVDGITRIVSYRTLADYPFMVTVGTSYAEDVAPVLQRRGYYLAVATAMSVLLLALAALLIVMLMRRRKAAAAMRASEALYKATFHQAAMGIAHVRPDGRIMGVNERFRCMLGYSEDELRGRNLVDLGDEKERDALRRFLRQCATGTTASTSRETEKTYMRIDGSILWVHEALAVVKDPAGKVDFLVATTQDITARKQLEARLAHDALHDALTGLSNRVLFGDRLAQALNIAPRRQQAVAVLYIDLDGFKAVNDTHGHGVGDELLREVARRMTASIRQGDTVARFGGDEFGIVLTGLAGGIDDARRIAAKIDAVLSAPYEVDGIVLEVRASVGVAVFPDHAQDPAGLLAHADAAMYETKHEHKQAGLQGVAMM